GPTPDDGIRAGTYTQTNVTGAINLTGATLQLTHLVATSVGETFIIVHTTGGVSGAFAGLAEGGSILAQDGTLYTIAYQANAVQGVATFSDLNLDKAGTGYTVTASAGSMSTATTNAFAVTSGSPSQLVVRRGLPSTVQAGVAVSPAVEVVVRDAFGNDALND